ncbi:translation initiation factor eIF3 subunit g [Blastocladiella emersonii ATCC 22665]|nr:translation initiation factor eIF3 subunit g [Blastocladiella emersonii ATCC 22665]
MSSAQDLPLPSIHAGKNGIVTHIYYKHDAAGRKVQVKRTLRIGRDLEASKRAIEARKAWPKFGSVKHMSNDEEVTRVDTEFPLRMVTNPDDLDAPETAVEAAKRATKDSSIKCRACGGPHWTKECPSKDIIQSLQDATAGLLDGGAGAGADGGAPSSGRYVPPSLRGGDGAPRGDGMTMMPPRRMEDSYPVRIANLPSEMTDDDLGNLTRVFGHVVRSYLAKDDEGWCKGYAFVNFATFDSAQRAVARLNGYGYANLIMTCEHSQPRPPKN